MKTILAALLSLSAFQCAQAQWTIQNSPALPNSFIYQVEAVDANTAWAASPFMEVVKTTDSGLTWDSYPITDPVFTSANVTAVSALDANTAWIIVGEMGQTYFSRIYRTTDGGRVLPGDDGSLQLRECIPGWKQTQCQWLGAGNAWIFSGAGARCKCPAR